MLNIAYRDTELSMFWDSLLLTEDYLLSSKSQGCVEVELISYT